MQQNLFVLTLPIFLLSFTVLDAHAGSLKDYKEQKHNRRKRVDAGSCEPEYIRTCQADCAPGNSSCMKDCETQAPSEKGDYVSEADFGPTFGLYQSKLAVSFESGGRLPLHTQHWTDFDF